MPETRYARSGDVNIAYQVFGEGETPLVWIPGFVQHLELNWEEPHRRAWFEGLGRFARVIILDKRRTGLSDRVRYYWPRPAVQAALSRLRENIAAARPEPGIVAQALGGLVDPAPDPLELVRRTAEELSSQ